MCPPSAPGDTRRFTRREVKMVPLSRDIFLGSFDCSVYCTSQGIDTTHRYSDRILEISIRGDIDNIRTSICISSCMDSGEWSIILIWGKSGSRSGTINRIFSYSGDCHMSSARTSFLHLFSYVYDSFGYGISGIIIFRNYLYLDICPWTLTRTPFD